MWYYCTLQQGLPSILTVVGSSEVRPTTANLDRSAAIAFSARGVCRTDPAARAGPASAPPPATRPSTAAGDDDDDPGLVVGA